MTGKRRKRQSKLGLMTARCSRREKCAASRSGGEISFLHLGQITVSWPVRL